MHKYIDTDTENIKPAAHFAGKKPQKFFLVRLPFLAIKFSQSVCSCGH